MEAADIKMYDSSLEIVKGNKTEGCGDWLGSRITTNYTNNESALESMKEAARIFLFACIMRKDKDFKKMQFSIRACNSTLYDGNMIQEPVCTITYKDMIQKIKEGYRSPVFDTNRDKEQIQMRLSELGL